MNSFQTGLIRSRSIAKARSAALVRMVVLVLLCNLPTISTSLAQDFTQGLLWQIQSARGSTSHLFGTIHSEDPRVLKLPAVVKEAFDNADSLTIEMRLDMATVAAVGRAMFFSDDRRLDQLVPQELYSELTDIVLPYGIPAGLLPMMKPWAVTMMISIPKPVSGDFLDMQLYLGAVKVGKPVYGLEEFNEQIGVIDGMELKDQVLLLEEAVRQQPDLHRYTEELHQAYLRRDLAGLQKISKAGMSEKIKPLAERFLARLLDERNERMTSRMQSRLEEGGGFIAVGALHLPGRQGILQRLERLGYRLRRLY